jgi:hypothetical protein
MRLARHWKKSVAAATLATIGILGVAATDASAAPPPPTAATCTTPLVLRSIEIVRTVTGPAIMVTGIKPYDNTRVALVPEDVVYVQQPDYWNYSILGCGGSGLIRKVPFTEVLPIDGPVGKYGIAIAGRTFDLPGGPTGPATS